VFNEIDKITRLEWLASVTAIVSSILYGLLFSKAVNVDNNHNLKKISVLENEKKEYENVIFNILKKINDEKFYAALKEENYNELKNLIPPTEYMDAIEDEFTHRQNIPISILHA